MPNNWRRAPKRRRIYRRPSHAQSSPTAQRQAVPLQKPVRPGGAGRTIRRLIGVVILMLVLGSGIFGYKILAASNKISVTERSILGQLKDLLFSSGDHLEGEQDGRINVLLIAIGGEGHKGQNLADTIMIASIDPTTNHIALLSIPRDLYVQIPGEEYYSRINGIHSYGESKKTDLGPKLLKEKVEEITSLPIHYYARVDFIAFKHVIDAIGGIDITIDSTFYDYWHKISFPAGTERMNGERALAYVRARYVEGSEGGDFKRAARQQQVLLAIREKIFSTSTAFDFATISSVLDSLATNIRTDMELWEMKRFYEIVRSVDSAKIKTTVLATGPQGVLIGETELLGDTPASVLKPRTGDYSEIQTIAKGLLDDIIDNPASPQPEVLPSPSPSETSPPDLSEVTIEIRNGTNINGLAAETKGQLETKGYTVATISNAATRDYTRTTIYALDIDKADMVGQLAELLNGQTDSGLPANEAESTVDILIILGANE